MTHTEYCKVILLLMQQLERLSRCAVNVVYLCVCVSYIYMYVPILSFRELLTARQIRESFRNRPILLLLRNLVPKRWDKKRLRCTDAISEAQQAVTGRYNGRQNTSIIPRMGVYIYIYIYNMSQIKALYWNEKLSGCVCAFFSANTRRT